MVHQRGGAGAVHVPQGRLPRRPVHGLRRPGADRKGENRASGRHGEAGDALQVRRRPVQAPSRQACRDFLGEICQLLLFHLPWPRLNNPVKLIYLSTNVKVCDIILC